MRLFGFLHTSDINRDVEQFRETENALLLDVRGPDEYAEGHIPGSQNIPLQVLDQVDSLADSIDTALYIYCHSGVRSRQAATMLQHMGYRNITNIRMILTGLRSGIAPERLRERLRETYV